MPGPTKEVGKTTPWDRNFRVEYAAFDPETGQSVLKPSPGNAIRLHQLNRKEFELACRITYYRGKTGLEGKEGMTPAALLEIRTVTHADLGGPTDLVSVPRWMRWYVGRYGEHTPAALVHDRFIGIDPKNQVEGMSDERADRFFRFMLQRSGVSFLKRWIMWAGVAFRTRFAAGGLKRATVILWVVGLASIIGFASASVSDRDWIRAAWVALLAAPLALLWGRQVGAGLIAAYVAAPLVLPATLLALASDGLLWLLDKLLGVFLPRTIAGRVVRPGSFEVTRQRSVEVIEAPATPPRDREPEGDGRTPKATEDGPGVIAAGPSRPEIDEDGWWFDEE